MPLIPPKRRNIPMAVHGLSYVGVTLALWLAALTVCTPSSAQQAASAEAAAQPPTANANPGSTDWPVDRGDASATGAVQQTLPQNLVELWRYSAGESVDSTAVVASGRVFIGDVAGTVHALDLQSGKLLWKQATDLGFIAPPSATEKLVIIGDLDGIVYAYEAETGKLQWKFQAGAEIGAGVTILDETILVSSQDGLLYALSPVNGELQWKYETGDQIRSRPAVVTDLTFLGGCDGSLHRIRITDGESADSPLPLDGPTGSTPAVFGDLAFLPTQSGSVLAFNWKTGQQLWSYVDPDRPEEFRNSAAVTDNHVIVASKNRTVLSLNPETGTVQWTTTLRKRADGSPVIAGTDVWVAAADGRLYRLSLADGSILWQHEERGAFAGAPAIAGDRLIVANDKGVVICFGTK